MMNLKLQKTYLKGITPSSVWLERANPPESSAERARYTSKASSSTNSYKSSAEDTHTQVVSTSNDLRQVMKDLVCTD